MSFFCLMLLLFGATSCDIRQTPGRQTIPLVESIVSNPQSAEAKMLAAHKEYDIQADIYLLDEPSRCLQLSETMMKYDRHDNYDGAMKSDNLPDFAGEKITSILDYKYSPYLSYPGAGNDQDLREIAVRLSLAAVNTESSDTVHAVKPTAKLLVLSSPVISYAASFDIDTLFSSTSTAVSLVSALDLSFEYFLSSFNSSFSLGVICDSLTYCPEAYQKTFSRIAAAHGDKNSSCVSVQTFGESTVDTLRSFLDHYFESGNRAPLSAILVDDWGADIDVIRASYEDIKSSEEESDEFYRKLLSKKFIVVDSRDIVSEECYNLLRSKNLFSHNISYPEACTFVITDSNPGTYKSYVQDQHISGGN